MITKSEREEVELISWFSQLPGRAILECEIEAMSTLLPNLFGYHLLFIGPHPYTSLVRSSRVQFAAFIDTDGPNEVEALGLPLARAAADDLPVRTDSVDVIVLPHVLEFESQPHRALREIERVLVPDGHLLLSGFNPISMMGLWRLMKRHRGQPWSGQFFSLARLCDWLVLLGFDILEVRYRFFRPPINNQHFLTQTLAFETVGARLCPYLSGTYIVLARKRLTTFTPVRPLWRPKRRLVGMGVAGTASHSAK